MNKYIEKVDLYLSGEMGEEERAEFEEALKTDKELQLAMDIHKNIEFSIRHRDTLQFVDGVMEDLNGSDRQSSFFANPIIKVAAILVVLIGISAVVVLLINKDESKDRALAGYFGVEKIDYQFRGEDDIYKNAVILYNESRYEEAAKQLSEIVYDDSDDIRARFYLGLSLISDKKFQKGRAIMESIYKSADVNFSIDARWYMIWCYINLGEKDNAKTHLQEMRNDTYYHDKADKVLKLLNDKSI